MSDDNSQRNNINGLAILTVAGILMSIVLYNFKELTKSIEEVERIEASPNYDLKGHYRTS